jgi:CubicO group peptidase (beta-lactamase class C family)
MRNMQLSFLCVLLRWSLALWCETAQASSETVLKEEKIVVAKKGEEGVAGDEKWKAVDTLINDAIQDSVFPGAVAMVGSKDGLLFTGHYGHFTYGPAPPNNSGENPATDLDSLFDVASLSKVVATTSAVMKLYEDGYLSDLDATVESVLGIKFAHGGKENITIKDCLLHTSGFPPDPNPFYCTKAFACPDMGPTLSFSCRQSIYQSILRQKLQNPVGEVFVYSDLNFMTLMFVVGTVVMENNLADKGLLQPGCVRGEVSDAQCYYAAYLVDNVFGHMGMAHSLYMPDLAEWPDCVPAENMTTSTDCQTWQMQGQVSDGNAYALGGIGGHAGLFSTGNDLGVFMRYMMGYEQSEKLWNATTLALFTTVDDPDFSSRALGWDTNLVAQGSDLCGNMSALTFTHTGYTGTQVCGDLGNDFYTVLLTNRVYPTDEQGSEQINEVRKAFANTVLDVLGYSN